MDNQLFRKAALDKLASPERLDVLMQVTSPKGWLALWTVGGVLLCVIAWSIFGSIPRRVDGAGILIRGGGLRELRAEGDGVLSKFDVVVGQELTEGQLVGEIARVQVEQSVAGAQTKYEQAMQELAAASAEDQSAIAQTRAQIARYESDIQRTEAQIRLKEADAADKRELLKKGLVTKARVDALEAEVLGLRSTLTGTRAQITQLYNSIQAIQQRTRAKATSVEFAKDELSRTSKTAASVTEVRCTVLGRVVEVKKRTGDRVQLGEALVLIEPPSVGLEPIVYVDSSIGKRIKPGMEAQIAPSTVKREEHGFMRGLIKSVGDYPVTPQAVQARVANQSLAQELLGDTAKIEVAAQLVPDKSTASGYQWSSSSGPPFKIDGGTRITVSVIYERRAPISLVLPIIRGTFGAS
jgi:HlyD family secretion protein